MLYMFQAVPPPIIRRSKLYIQHQDFVKPLLLPATAVAGSSKGLTKYPMLYDCSGTVVKALCYKSEGRWFDSKWCHWNFSLT